MIGFFVLSLLTITVKAAYEAGVNAQKAEYLEAQNELNRLWDEKLKTAVTEAKQQAAEEHQLAMETLNNENQIEKESRQIERTIYKTVFKCPSLGSHFHRLFNCGIQAKPGCINPGTNKN